MVAAAAGDASLSAPLLASDHIVLTVHPDAADCRRPLIPPTADDGNPFAFIGARDGVESPDTSPIDPFRNHTAAAVGGLYEGLKILACLPLAAARLVLFGACLAVGFVATLLALQGWKDRQNPMPQWRRRAMWVTRLCARAILFSFGYHWIKRKGKPARREIAPIIVSNHVSYIEPIFFFYELFPIIVSSESHDSMPFVGTIIRAMQVIYVDRFSRSSRKHAVNEIKRKASCNRFPQVLLFPEGTTSNGRVIISFQLGAFIPGYPVQPVAVRYPYVHFDQSWGNIALGKLMFRMLTQFHNFMEVEYLPIVSPNEIHKESAAHFAQRTARAIATALNVPQTSHSFGDFLLLAKAAESKQENTALYMVEMAWIQSALHLRALEAVEFLEIFLSMNPDRSGYVEFHDFIGTLRLKPCSLAEKIFGFVDVQKLGKITFKQPLFRHACELSFRECDVNETNYVLKPEFHDVVSMAIPSLKFDEIDALFTLFDVDGDRRISKNDFVLCMKRNPLLIALFAPKLVRKGVSLPEASLVEEVY
ncbi:lysophospholipid acyltransferase LPEAT2-like isoform X2 [Andrographis paniculata]|uniref:lysophospholipid acyltransferase LPEAT2-like isoform X2 n=1 Tax=Andrographis paniculata TaxID=175694 RepID=UPI0021E932E9|nr:lysophospholipid acyltransferase LPEAT2-like isoform X2 [Andrographis paniculata]